MQMIFFSLYCRSYAYVSIKDRMPVILTKVIDTICQKKNEIIYVYGQVILLFKQYQYSIVLQYAK